MSQGRRSRETNTGTGEDYTLNNMKYFRDPAPDQQPDGSEERDDEFNPEDLNDSKDSNYLPLSEEEVSLGAKDFIVPEDPLDQERFKWKLIATTRSLKKKQQQIH